VSIEDAFDLAVRKHEAGKLSEAAELYRRVLAAEPGHRDAIHLLGVIAYQSRDYATAGRLIADAIRLNPDCAEYYGNLGLVLMATGQVDQAIAAYKKALRLKPAFPEALSNLAESLLAKGELDEAANAARHALELRPDLAAAATALGNALLRKNSLDDAVIAFQKSLALRPNEPRSNYNMGVVLQARGDFAGAIQAYQKALELRPDFLEAQNNLGSAYQATGRNDEAIAAFQQAITIQGTYLPAHNNLCVILAASHRYDESIAAAQRALAIKPDWAEGHLRLGFALRYTGKLREGAAAYQRAVEIDPTNAVADSNRVFALQFDPDIDAHTILREHLLWDQRHGLPLKSQWIPHANDRHPNRRLRVGYVSPDFRSHCQSLFTLPLLANHDRNEVEVFCYSSAAFPDATTDRLRRHSDVWRNVAGVSDSALAKLVREDRIDILIDLTMHMAGGRPLLFARKPAPVQVAWLAYPGTTGLSAIDYRLTDPHLDPPGQYDDCYAEKSVRLRDTFWCIDPMALEPDQKPPQIAPPPHLKNGYITFGCLNNFFKINDGVLKAWAAVLNAVAQSHLLILAPPGSARQFACDELAKHGINPNRIEFVPRQPHQGYLELFNRIDISLDTFPYNGHTTSLDSIWMGVPVVSRIGHTVVGRAGLSQSRNLQLPELVAPTDEAMTNIAIKLALDTHRLTDLWQTLRERMLASPLTDAPRFCRNIEAAYRQTWREWCGG
jgi:protein O-GlcNAc transferase